MSRKLPLSRSGPLKCDADFEESLRQMRLLGEEVIELCRDKGWYIDPKHPLMLTANDDDTWAVTVTLDDTEGLKPC